ncbi:MAG: type II secretion system secretin GspD [Xanthomonadaceae bacterium]|nr:type II secretion system secretin GspD [Xanthomonadaceae bacterium]
MPRFLLIAFLILFAAELAAQDGAAIRPIVATAPVPAGNGDAARHTLNLKSADIGVLIETVSQITGRSFIVDPRVDGKVTVISSVALDEAGVWSTFESVLRVHGFAVVAAGNMWKVVPEGIATTDGGVASRAESPDAMISRVISVQHVSAGEIATLLRPLLPQAAQLAAQGGNLIVTDRAGNVERIEQLVRRIDVAASAEVEVVALRHANAAEIARTLGQLEQAGAAAPGSVGAKLISDARTNSVLLSGDRSARLRLRTLIAHLDTPLTDGDSSQVIYLRYARATDLVPVLEEIAASLTGVANDDSGARAAVINSHDETNALVITAAPAVFRDLAAVVRQLDIRRAQVLVEAVIADVSDELADSLGIQWQATGISNNPDGSLSNGVIGGTNFTSAGGGGILGASINPLGVGPGLNLGYLDGTVRLPVGPDGAMVDVLQLGVLVQALRGDGRANILSRPSVVTLDHNPAVFKVAQEVPFITGSFTSTGQGGNNLPDNPFQTIERRDVGLILEVTPHVNEGDSVRLDIVQEISSLAPPAQGAADLITNKREVRTSVLVPDGGMLVLGGLNSEEVGEAIQGVPGLSRIPVLGNLFKTRNTTRSKRNLMIFLRPYILRDAVTEAAMSNEKYNFLRSEQIQMQERFEGKIRGGDLPRLPENPNDLFMNPPALIQSPISAPPEAGGD